MLETAKGDAMTGTQDLRAEHAGVGRILSIMDVMARQMRAGASPNHDDLDHVIEFLRIFVDQCHHAKEEQLLFPALRTAGITAVDETLRILTAEHTHGRELVARIATAAGRLPGEEDYDNDGLVQAMTEFTALLRAHIRREENDCFSVADRELPPAVQDELNEGYDRIEREVVGEGRHEVFHELLDRLSKAYAR